MSNEAVLSQCYVLTNKRVRLYPTSTTNDTAFLYLNEGADKHVVPEFTFINVDRFDNTDIGPIGNDSNLLIVFYVQIMPDDLVMQLHRF